MKYSGFTLIELMIVLTLISILSMIAYPSYNEHIIKVRRIHMAAALLDLAGRMEKYYIQNKTYNGANPEKLSAANEQYKDYYNLNIKTKDDNYTLEAIPIGKQVKDIACGSLIIDQNGNKSVSGSEPPMKCWL